jgi:hypothetical protein
MGSALFLNRIFPRLVEGGGQQGMDRLRPLDFSKGFSICIAKPFARSAASSISL